MDRFLTLALCLVFSRTAYTKIVRRSSGHSEHGNGTHILWGYDEKLGYGPSHWGSACTVTSRQSPVNVDTSATKLDPELKMPILGGYDRPVGNVTMVNNGHSVSISLNPGMNMTLPGNGKTFRAVSFHFHWGNDNTNGSEHTVDGKPFPMEMHVVHINTKYANLKAAINHNDGLAVLGFFIVIGKSNSNFDSITGNFEYIPHRGNATTISGFSLKDLVQPAMTRRRIWRYGGSLTTPPCSEAVTWTIYSDTIAMSVDQMNQFHKMIDLDDHVHQNHRPTKPLGERTVYASFGSGSNIVAVDYFVFFLLASFNLLRFA